jgi:hypothetical protein
VHDGTEWRLLRIDATGVRVGADPPLPGDGLRSVAPQRLAWAGRSWAVAFERETYTWECGSYDVEAVFDRLACGDACDHDGDGAAAMTVICGGDDCDDLDRSVHPGAAERCDGFDDDCDRIIDDVCSG